MRIFTKISLQLGAKALWLLALWLGLAGSLAAQTANQYTFSSSTGTLDPMTGATIVLGSSNDDTPSGVQSIGFTFTYEGVAYTQFSMSPDGFIKLGGVAASSQFTNAITSTTNIPKLFPYWDDLATGTNGNGSMVVTGSAPNRILKIQWFVTIPRNTTGPANSTMQLWLYETSNLIECRYGAVGGNSTSASLGINGTTATNFHSITTPANTSSTSTANDANTVWPGNGTMFSFSPPVACSGAPNAGATASTANPACSGVNFTLSLSGATTGASGLTYQWQTSPNGSSYSNALGTGATFTTSQLAATFYRCIVTCTGSGISATSTPLQVGLAAPNQCYCIPNTTSGCSFSDQIDKVTFGTLVNPASGNSGCTGSYTQYLTGLPIPNITQGSTYPISVLVGPGGTEYAGVFFDWNQDGDFLDASEAQILGSGNGSTVSGNVTVPLGATVGQTRLRVRVVYNTTTFDACSTYSFGEAEDYLVNVQLFVVAPSCLTGPTAPAIGSSICPGAATLSWGAASGATGYDVYFGTSATPSLVSSNQAGTTYNAGTLANNTTYFWRVEPRNAAGAATGCSTWSFSTADNQPPTYSGCPANSIVGTQAPNCSAVVNYTTPTASDNCGVASSVRTQGPASGSAFPLGNTTVVHTATDVAGLTVQCIFTVTVNDVTPPTITCPNNIVATAGGAGCNAVVNYSVTADDNCSGNLTPILVSGQASGSTYALGTVNHVWRAVDLAGNSSTCGFSVTVVDNVQPTITTCPPNIMLATNSNCEAVLGNYIGQTSANDNCGTPVITQSPAPGSTVPGFSTVTMTATDGAGNTSTCTFQTTAVDNSAPTIICAAEQFINATTTAPCTGTLPNFTGIQNATDNCGVPTVTQSPAAGSTVPFGQSNVFFTATDGAGFSATCSMQVTVVDVTPPVITCPPSVTLSTGTDPNTCSAVATFQCAVAPDNCYGSANPQQVDGLPSGSAFPRGVNLVVFKATDQAGNSATCSFTITVVDDQAPYLACPQNISKNTDAGLCTALISWTGVVTTDNCDAPTLVQTGGPANNTAFPKGVTTVSFRSTDATGNSSNCSFTVTVVDAELPVITCPANIVRSTDLNLCTAAVAYTVSATDNCPGVTIAQISGLASGAAFPKGVTTNTWRATDAAGNTSTCSFTVTVNDTQAPTITCPANIVRSNTLNLCGATVTYTVTATDNCPGVTTTQTTGLASGSFFPVGVTTNVHRATDAAGNTSTCSFTVTVNDTQLPVLMCPTGNINVNNAPNQCAGVATWAPIMATDNCPGVVVTFVSGMASGSLFPVGVTTIVYRATDAAGNNTQCSWTVTVKDVQKPSISCPSDIQKNNDWDKCSATIPFIGTPMVSDNCGVASNTSNALGTYPVGVTNVTFSVVDVNGNTNSCVTKITVKDYQPPTINCPANISALSDPAAYCGAQVPFNVTATDNCPGVTVVWTAWPKADNGYYPIGVTMIMATATDNVGNTSGCMFRITVVPAPEICNGLDDDCDGLIDEDQSMAEVAKQFEQNGKSGDLYGTSVGISGDYAIVGAKGENQNAGAAYILFRNQGGLGKWGRISKLLPVLIGPGDGFGTSVAINGNWAIVGAPGEHKAFLYNKDQGGDNNWGFVKAIQATNGSADDNFGTAVAISGDYALVGASMDDEKGLNAGAAYVFNKDQGGIGAWGQVAKLAGVDTQAGDMFGSTVDLEGEMAIVGSPLNDEKGLNAGAAYLFDRSTGWGQAKKLTASDPATLDNFGVSVSMSGTTVAVGSNQDDDKGSSSGSVYVYDKNKGGNATWGQTTKLTAIDGTANDQLGYAVALSGRYLAAGARFDDPRGFKSGSMYVYFRQDDGTWVQLTKFFETSGDARDYFASALDIANGTIIGGAPGDDFGAVAEKGSVAFFSSGCDGNYDGGAEDRDEQLALNSELGVRTFPQPFSSVLNIEVSTTAATEARIVIWNSLGQEVATVFNGTLEGQQIFQWTPGAHQPGAYYLRVETGEKTEVKPLLLVR